MIMTWCTIRGLREYEFNPLSVPGGDSLTSLLDKMKWEDRKKC